MEDFIKVFQENSQYGPATKPSILPPKVWNQNINVVPALSWSFRTQELIRWSYDEKESFAFYIYMYTYTYIYKIYLYLYMHNAKELAFKGSFVLCDTCGELKDTLIGKIILAWRNNNCTCICIFVEAAMIELKRSKQCNGCFSAEVWRRMRMGWWRKTKPWLVRKKELFCAIDRCCASM